MPESGGEIALRERRVGRIEACAEDSALIAATQVQGPGGVWLVLQHLAAHEVERVLERRACIRSRLVGGALEQLVEAVEVERDELGREAVRLRFRHDELARTFRVGRKVATKDRNERLQRAGDIPWAVSAPQQLGEAVGRNTMPARREQDFEHLLRSRPAQVARPQAAAAVLDRE